MSEAKQGFLHHSIARVLVQDRDEELRSAVFGHQGFADDEYSRTDELALSKLVESRLVQ